MPPVTAIPQGGAGRAPTTVDKLKMGGLMGGTVGLIIGFIFGATNIIRFGAGAQGPMRTLGQYMLGSSATFGFFMSIGSVIRTDASPIVAEAYSRAHRRPMIMPRNYPQKTQDRSSE